MEIKIKEDNGKADILITNINLKSKKDLKAIQRNFRSLFRYAEQNKLNILLKRLNKILEIRNIKSLW
jgi:hypothetical protein